MKIIRFALISLLLAASLFLTSCGGASSTGLQVTTFAGVLGPLGVADGLPADDPDVGPALFNNPWGIASDGTNLYIADSNSNTVRKMNIASRIVTTLAGSPGMSGTADGTGSAARFNGPFDMVSDGTNLYVVDAGNSTIRKIVIATGVVTTFAGTAGVTGFGDGNGSAASFNIPLHAALCGSDLYVTDWNNSAIRRVDTTTGDVTTFASGVAVDLTTTMACDSTSLYFPDYSTDTVLQYNLGTASVTTFAGSGASGCLGTVDGTGATATFCNPTNVATDGTDVYVTDFNSTKIRKINIATTNVTTLAGNPGKAPLLVGGYDDEAGTEATFYTIKDIAVTGGNLYIIDQNTVRRLNLSGNGVTTFAGTGPLGFVSGSTDGAGTGPGKFYMPFGIASDGTSLYVTDYHANTIRKIDKATRLTTTFAGLAGPVKPGYDYSSLYSGTADGVGAAARFYQPAGITNTGGFLYVTDIANHTVRRVSTATREVTTFAGSPANTTMIDGTGTAAGFAAPYFIVTDGTDLYVSDNGSIRKIVISTGQVTTLTTPFVSVMGMSIIGRKLYVADFGDHTIQVVDLDTNGVTSLAGSSGNAGTADGIGSAALFTGPLGVTNDGSNLYATDGNGVRKVVAATGEVTTIAGDVAAAGTADGAAATAGFSTPVDITWDGSALYVTEFSAARIRRIQ